ncbi:HigA family addiction module antitoxin [Longimicrobium sp.]|uniref:HigA family addiction module antitoxin n=1 Tax=Longimicrobium sp. TaxID=2029185 RepID=UPI002D807D8F|nr:HigA family addiction module antitoxin [Longimicrobium sp.]
MHGFSPQDLLIRVPTHGPSPHPGEMLREDYLPDYGWSAEEFAARLRVPLAVVEELLAERVPVTPELALRLAKLFRQSPGMWIKMQLAHDYWDAFRAADADLEQIVPVDDVEAEPEPVRKAS